MKEHLRAAFIGLGSRGMNLIRTVQSIDDLDIVAVCDILPERLQEGINVMTELGVKAQGYTDYRRIIDRGDIDLVYIATNWITHWTIAVDFMEAGIYTACEVCGATTIEECWQLVRTYERTGTPMMLLENCCYGRDELAVLNMVRQGLFGKVVYAEGGYLHDLREHISDTTHQRCNNNFYRSGDLYPTHGALPMGKILNINHGNRFVSISSMTTAACGMKDYLGRKKPDHKLSNEQYACGDVTISMLKCAGGEVMTLRHCISLPRPYSRSNVIQGTRGIYTEGFGVHIEDMHEEGHWEAMEEIYKKYDHPLWQNYDPDSHEGHGGMDYLVMAAFADAARNRTLPPIDVYDAATYMAITPLSEQSIVMGGTPQAFPDFTCGKWASGREVNGGIWALDKEKLF